MSSEDGREELRRPDDAVVLEKTLQRDCLVLLIPAKNRFDRELVIVDSLNAVAIHRSGAGKVFVVPVCHQDIRWFYVSMDYWQVPLVHLK